MSARKRIAWALAVAFALGLAPRPVRAWQLIVPLTGHRHKTIDPRTLFHTLLTDFFPQPDGTTYVQTGDIPAMWLRDSAAQTIPYIPFVRYYQPVALRVRGAIAREALDIDTDPYANAFQADFHIWERKWEIDSLAWPVLLAWTYYNETHDRSIFTPALHRAFAKIVATYACERKHATCSSYRYPYKTWTHSAYNPNAGMIWSAFRPSDDPVVYRYNVPQNALAVIALEELASLSGSGWHDRALAKRALTLAERVFIGIERYGIVNDPRTGRRIYAYEVDGLGHAKLMDDANVPSLLSLPYIGWCGTDDRLYVRTRNFVLSPSDPYYFSGLYAAGIGSPHTPYDNVWPLSIITRALTSTSSAEVAEAITELAETDGSAGLIHESFYVNGWWRYTRADFGWANALYAELLFRSIATFRQPPMLPFGTLVGRRRITETPTLVPPLVQFENSGTIFAALAAVLNERRASDQ